MTNISSDKPEFDNDAPDDPGAALSEFVAASERLNDELSFLFGRETVVQAEQIDIVDLNLNEDIIASISNGVRQLKELKNNPQAQAELIREMAPGSRIVLCMWIMEMGLLEKIQTRSYLCE